MKARDIMTKDPSCVTPDTPVRDAAKLMQRDDVGMLPVVESKGSKKLVGIVTDRDIAIRHVAEGHASPDCPVSEAMTDRLVTSRENDDVNDLMKVMGREQVRRIPIVDESGSIIGVVAQADIVREAKDDGRAERTVEKISEPGGRHSH